MDRLCIDCTVCSVIETSEGSIIRETTGSYQESNMFSGPFVVLYQRGLACNSRRPTRSHVNIISKFKIKCKKSERFANVPWKNFAWHSREMKNAFVGKAYCSSCGHKECSASFKNVTAENVKVVFTHGVDGVVRFQWYVAFTGGGGVLSRVPDNVINSILRHVEIRKPEGVCTCGHCKHELLTMLQKNDPLDDFCGSAVKLFAQFRYSVRKHVFNEEYLTSSIEAVECDRMEDGTCAICLEDTHVYTNGCIQKRCKLKICKQCQTKTMGLCPLCDRAKLSSRATFQCNACRSGVCLDEFCFPCITCKSACLCYTCYRKYEQCICCDVKSIN